MTRKFATLSLILALPLTACGMDSLDASQVVAEPSSNQAAPSTTATSRNISALDGQSGRSLHVDLKGSAGSADFSVKLPSGRLLPFDELNRMAQAQTGKDLSGREFEIQFRPNAGSTAGTDNRDVIIIRFPNGDVIIIIT